MGITQLAAGRDRSVVLTNKGEAWAWGALRTWDASAPTNLQPPEGEVCSSDPALVGHNRYAQPHALLLNAATPFALIAESHTQILAVCRAGNAFACKPVVDPRRGAIHQRLAGLPASIAQLAATASVGLALDGKGTVWSWGPSNHGQLGRAAQAWLAGPGAVTGLPAIARLAAGNAHALALDCQGAVWAWGANAAGQLGNGTLTENREPTQITLPEPIAQIAAGDTHSLALDASGQLWAWGSNQHGQTGLAGSVYYTQPQRVPLDFPLAYLDGGMFYTAALSSQGEVFAWGWNGLGQTGHSTNTSTHQPARISGLKHMTLLAAGSGHLLASDGQRVFAWGDNRSATCGTSAAQSCIRSPRPITLA